MTSFRLPADALLLIGPTGAGKTPLGDLFEEKGVNGRRCLHFDFGSRLRVIAGEPEPPGGFEKHEHAFIRDVLGKGLLLEDEHFYLAEKIVLSFMERKGFGRGDLLVLNGLPRHRGQAEDMKHLVRVRGLLVLDCTAEDVSARIRGNSGGDRSGRSDDHPELVSRKLKTYTKRTAPLIEYFAGTGAGVHHVRVTPASVSEDLYRAFCRQMTALL